MLAINEILQDRYRIIRQLGHGGMGAVYEARDERLGSSVALKEIIVELNKIPTEKQRDLFLRAFEREAKLLANLHHEAFPRVMDYFSEENRQFLIMELVHGDDLGTQLDKTKKPFPLENTLKWIDQLLDALDYLHTQSSPIYHRDIKPQNLKVNLRGKIKLLDFGIAKSVDSGASTMTNHTFVGATLNYAPIEQILPAITATFREFIILKHNDKAQLVLNQNTNAQCDIYAVGATFYHLLTNRTPVDAAKRSLEIWEGNADPLPNPSELNPEIPLSISAFLLKAMEIERENRFSTALEMQEALQTAIRPEKNRQKTEEEKRTGSEEITLSLIENRHLTVAQEQKTADQNLPGIKTERLIPKREIMLGTKKESVENTQASPTQSANTQPSNIEATPINPPVTETQPTEVFSTQPSGSVSKPELTGTPYFDKNLVAEPKREFAPVPPVVNPVSQPKPPAKPFWLIPIAAVVVLIAGSVGGFVWLNGTSGTSSGVKTTANQTASNSTTSTSVSANSSPTVSPTASPTPGNSPSGAAPQDEKTKTPTAPTQTKPAVQNTRTPQPQPTKPPQSTSNPTYSNDCIYNGKNCPKN
jgi:serine/threonine protein kinase